MRHRLDVLAQDIIVSGSRGARPQYFPKVGTARPSHLLYAAGVGAPVDLPSLSVLVRGLDLWDYTRVSKSRVAEERLLGAVRRVLGDQVAELLEPPVLLDGGYGAHEEADRVGVPVIPFPQWLRCTACDRLGRIEEGTLWRLRTVPGRPDLAQFQHSQCTSRVRNPVAVPARFVVACPEGHLDEFPWVGFVHRGQQCTLGQGGRLTMKDRGNAVGPDVEIECECSQRRNMRESIGREGALNLPNCRGRHPHLGLFEECAQPDQVRTLILGASNQWFGVSLSALHLPRSEGGLGALVEERWAKLSDVTTQEILDYLLAHEPSLADLRPHGAAAVFKAMEEFRNRETAANEPANLKVAEYAALTNPHAFSSSDDFTVKEVAVPASARSLVRRVVLVERLKVAQALVGFTRLDAPDMEQGATPDALVRLAIGKPTWVPAAQTRGEGIFLELREDVLAPWEAAADSHHHLHALEAAYVRFRAKRGRPPAGWPGARYVALHTISHLLIRELAMECGYSSASLAERIYCDLDGEKGAGILLYTAAPDSEGTLGGLVAMGQPERLGDLLQRAFDDARWCSSDPLCAEREPVDPDEFVNGAACHACLYVSETTCERGNRFLDRSLVVPLEAYPDLALLGQA